MRVIDTFSVVDDAAAAPSACFEIQMYPLTPKITSTSPPPLAVLIVQTCLRDRTTPPAPAAPPAPAPVALAPEVPLTDELDAPLPPVPVTARNTPFLNLPYFSDRVCNDAPPSECTVWTSATTRSPSLKKVRICSSSALVRRRRIPPGKLIAERGSCARRGAATSTFHRRDCTSTIRPTTRSPISGV